MSSMYDLLDRRENQVHAILIAIQMIMRDIRLDADGAALPDSYSQLETLADSIAFGHAPIGPKVAA